MLIQLWVCYWIRFFSKAWDVTAYQIKIKLSKLFGGWKTKSDTLKRFQIIQKKLILKQQISSEYWFQRTWNCVRHFKYIVNCNFILENDKWKNERRVNFCAKTSPITLEVMFLQRASTLQLRKNMHETEETSVANYQLKCPMGKNTYFVFDNFLAE